EKHTVSRMVGAPPGYIGYEEGGQLTDAVRRKPYSVILLDEIEKAHYDVFNILLQVLEDGRLTDSQGRTVDFRNTVIIMTSNAGANYLKDETAAVGFAAGSKPQAQDTGFERAKKQVLAEVKKLFKPEFLNRVDAMLVFRSLAQKELVQIVDILLQDLQLRLQELDIKLEISDAAKARIVEAGTDFKFGARPLKRAIQQLLEDEIAERLLRKEFTENDIISVDITGAEFSFKRQEKPVLV
ncbi:MAG: AAA family ATPase, partial [Selenomonadaceae bacterium]